MGGRRWADYKGKRATGTDRGSTFLPGFEVKEEGPTKNFYRTEAGMSMKTKGGSGKMPEQKSEKVGHLGIIEHKSRDICA